VLTDTIISNLTAGHSLLEHLKDPAIQKELADYPLLSDLIKNEMKVVIPQNDEANCLTESERLTLKNIKIHITKFQTLRFIHSKQLEATPSTTIFSSLFTVTKKAVIQPELVLIDTIISNLTAGHSLLEQLKDPVIQMELANYPLLGDLIKNEIKVVIPQNDDANFLNESARI
jgi:hypothetical protein